MKKNIYALSMVILLGLFLVGCSPTNNQSNSTNETKIEESVEETVSVLVDTEFGQVEGVSEEKALIWRGIPYGDDTSGENRWKAPQNPKKWNNVLETKEPGSLALQFSQNGAIGSEDALNLDIYRPNNNSKDLPVLVYIHGGNNQTGHAQEISGKSFVSNHDAIYVSVNYRLGVLGFNPLSALKKGSDEENSGNFGLLDIAFALDWVKNNIENFGGQKDNITVAGFSAGGRDVMAMLTSPLFKDKFQNAISFSGGMTIADEEKSQEVFATALAPLVVEDKVKDNKESAKEWLLSDDEEVRSYLMDLESERLAPLMGNAGIRMEVFPHLFNDGVVLPKDGFDTTIFNDVPLLMLTGQKEFSMFGMFDAYFSESYADGTIFTDETKSKEFEFVNTYGGQLYSLFNVNDSAEKLIENYQSPIYNMEISFGNNPDNIDESLQALASFHGVFVPLLDTDNHNYDVFIGDSYKSEGAKGMQVAFQEYIYNFIKNGDPNGENVPEWTQWTKDNKKNLILDADKNEYSAEMEEKVFTYEDVLVNIDQDSTISTEQKETLIKNVLNGRWFSYDLDKKYDNLSNFYK
ncbi:MAG: carboxylesterase family protein [Erysipelotrichaceae bacterium]|nr:carboxylesterase family protein [Erysipelotrichaceae bacterium]